VIVSFAGLGGDVLLPFLAGRRWFGAKGAAPRDARVVAVIPVPWGEGRMAIAAVDVVLGDDRIERYQLPILRDETGAIGDATEDPRFRAGLGEAIANRVVLEGDGARWIPESLDGEAGRIVGAESRVVAAEQSNTSIIYGDAAILKLFRRLEDGENPDVEIGRFLRRTAFTGTPALLATARLESSDGRRSVAAILQRYVPGSEDAWGYALESARRFVGRPESDELPPPFVDDARSLARVTRAMHDALASDTSDREFAPHAVTRDDVAVWAAAAKRSVEDGFAVLHNAVERGTLAGEAGGAARALLRRRAEFPALIEEIEHDVRDDAGMRIRCHGDYHLGQVLRTPDGAFMVIDFEGEPARPLAERRMRQSPLRDAAGMVSSFAYVAATAVAEVATRAPRPTVEVRSGRWLRETRRAFMEAYLTSPGRAGPAILPRHRASAGQLAAMFEIEKVFYELRYELNNRPDWVWIPLRGIARLTEVGAGAA
jgi:trehalose synthase-fused probable maltokinase